MEVVLYPPRLATGPYTTCPPPGASCVESAQVGDKTERVQVVSNPPRLARERCHYRGQIGVNGVESAQVGDHRQVQTCL